MLPAVELAGRARYAAYIAPCPLRVIDKRGPTRMRHFGTVEGPPQTARALAFIPGAPSRLSIAIAFFEVSVFCISWVQAAASGTGPRLKRSRRSIRFHPRTRDRPCSRL